MGDSRKESFLTGANSSAYCDSLMICFPRETNIPGLFPFCPLPRLIFRQGLQKCNYPEIQEPITVGLLCVHLINKPMFDCLKLLK